MTAIVKGLFVLFVVSVGYGMHLDDPVNDTKRSMEREAAEPEEARDCGKKEQVVNGDYFWKWQLDPQDRHLRSEIAQACTEGIPGICPRKPNLDAAIVCARRTDDAR